MKTQENTPETKTVKAKPFNWTEKRKAEAHKALVAMWNREELQKRNALNVEYLSDGTARSKTIGRVKREYKINLLNP